MFGVWEGDTLAASWLRKGVFVPVEIVIGGDSAHSWLLDMLIPAVPSVVTGILVAIIAFKLAVQRHRQEKLWERRADVYDMLFSALGNLLLALHRESSRKRTDWTDTAKRQIDEGIVRLYDVWQYAE